MSAIDRRALIGAAGATVALAACQKNPNLKQDVDQATLKGVGFDMTGIFPNFGNAVTKTKPDPLAAGVNFNPAYVCVVYLKMESNGEFTVRHGYEAYPAKAEDERALVETMLKQAASGQWQHTAAERVKRREHNFDNFSQNSQQRVWFFVDNTPKQMTFEDRNGDDFIIRFAPMSGIDPENRLPTNSNRKHYPNNAYFNIKVEKSISVSGLQGKTLISLDYWNTDHEGKPITVNPMAPIADHYLYAINIHLKLAMSKKAGPNQWLPMIVDPDGGNMGSQP